MQNKNNTTDILNSIIEGMKEKKGVDIVKIDLRKTENSITDYFIICHGSSNRQVDAIADHIENTLKNEHQERLIYKEGVKQAEWILLDYFNIIVHIFQKDTRNLYKLEELWADGEITKFNDLEVVSN